MISNYNFHTANILGLQLFMCQLPIVSSKILLNTTYVLYISNMGELAIGCVYKVDLPFQHICLYFSVTLGAKIACLVLFGRRGGAETSWKNATHNGPSCSLSLTVTFMYSFECTRSNLM